MLNPSDVYVTGGSDKLLVCWTDKVTKYDASSFYNWEQDNLPLHDLDERTQLTWEKFGHPTSALTGMSFIVSADASDSCSPLYFTTLSACVAALPEVINYPILVEVASFGNLGGLEISNKSFGPNGALEIINRNCSFGGAIDVNGSAMSVQQPDHTYSPLGPTQIYLASAITPAGSISATAHHGISAVPSLAFDAQTARIYSNNEFISSSYGDGSGWNDARYDTAQHYVFSRQVDGNKNNRLTASLSCTADPWLASGHWGSVVATYATVSSLNFTPFDSLRTTEMNAYDASTLNYRTGNELPWGVIDTTAGAAAFAYFNNLDYIKINECNGPIYIRNFNVDTNHVYGRGIEIKNSKVNLERCSVSRANEAGLYADNSEVNLLRGFVAYRNYKLVDGARTGTRYAEKRVGIISPPSGHAGRELGAGIYATNATVNFKSTYQRDLDKSLEASAIYENYINLASGAFPAPSMESLYCMSRNDIGIHAVNSKILGGRVETGGSSTLFWRDGTQVFSELNTEAGIRLENSVLENSGRLLLDGNFIGLDSYASKLFVDSLAARYNQTTGLKMNESSLTYNKDFYQGYLGTAADTVGPEQYVMSQLAFAMNGADIYASQSEILPVVANGMPDVYQMVYTSGAFGFGESASLEHAQLVPSIQAKNNSNLDLVHLHIDRAMTDATNRQNLGLFVNCDDNSTVTCRGSKEYANVFAGPDDSTGLKQLHVAGLYCNNNSTIKLQGPTASYQVGVNALSDNNSNIEITPHLDSDGELLVSAFTLSDTGNHTMVELHSTRACLVANRNSTLVIEDLGDKSVNWTTSGQNAIRDFSGQPLYTQGGFLQFYPNAAYQINNGDVAHKLTAPTTPYKFHAQANMPNKAYSYLYDTSDKDSFDEVTTGGMCVRAVENSLVQANNVHFPAGWKNTSAVVYDLDGISPLPGPNCSRLFIWNIADNSLLKASYLSVSGNYPASAGYYGPSGIWEGTTAGVAASGAPHSTPDTSSLSVLDYYGITDQHKYGQPKRQNHGVFRLYFSTDPAVNYLVTSGDSAGAASGNLNGFARQVFAQGYNFSGTLSAAGNSEFNGSSYTSLLRSVEGGLEHVAASGFYYASAMVLSPNTIKAVLDDSAANTFANAKHNSVGKSGLAKVVSIYLPAKVLGGDSWAGYSYGKGLASTNNFDLDKDN